MKSGMHAPKNGDMHAPSNGSMDVTVSDQEDGNTASICNSL